ncbi:MAG: hypothetical protein ABUK01_08130 [Leptospirales bacterium]
MSKTEAQTRREIIDKQLLEAGWDVNNLTRVSQEFDIEVDLHDRVKELAELLHTEHPHIREELLKNVYTPA